MIWMCTFDVQSIIMNNKPMKHATIDAPTQAPNPEKFAILNFQKCDQNPCVQTYTLKSAIFHRVDADHISANHKLCIH